MDRRSTSRYSQDAIQYLGKGRNNLWWPGQVQNLSLR